MPPDTSWFNEAKFGMFIHWGIYAVPGRGEWMLHDEKIPFDEYRSYASQFAPDEWDPQDWVNVAQQAGMRYMVLTARHHDGYCLYDSALSPDDFTAPRTAAKRDLVGEYVEAARASGQRVGLYYSLCDWHHPGWQAGPESDGWSEFIEYVHGQVRELCTNYGPLDVLWFDGGGPGCAHCWQAEKLVAMIRELQPDCLVNNRGLLPADFDTPEQKIEASEEGRLWESCLIIAHRWGYFRNEQYYKPATRLLLDMVNIANGGGNLVLNVGPTADGTIPQPQQEILREMGQWLAKHGEAVYDADRCRYGTHTCICYCGQARAGRSATWVTPSKAQGWLPPARRSSLYRRVIALSFRHWPRRHPTRTSPSSPWSWTASRKRPQNSQYVPSAQRQKP